MKAKEKKHGWKEDEWLRSQKLELAFQTTFPLYAKPAVTITEEDLRASVNALGHMLSLRYRATVRLFDGKDVLEVGCGSRGAICSMSQSGRRVAIDPLIDELRNRGMLYEVKGIEFYTQKVEQMDFPDGTFDYVLCFNVLDHVANVQSALEEMHRVLRPQGSLFLSVHTFLIITRAPFRFLLGRLDKTHPHHLSTPDVITGVRQAGFTVVSQEQSRLGLTYGGTLFRAGANAVGRTLWIQAMKTPE